jgi:hypothetical protein
MAFESDVGQSGRMASVDVTDARNNLVLATAFGRRREYGTANKS